MKRTLLLALLILPFLNLSVLQAQEDPSDGLIIPSDNFEDDLFGDLLGDDVFDESDSPILADDDDFLPPLDDEPTLQEVEASFSAELPLTATTQMSVVNISQNNANALETGARPGDILRYEFVVDSQVDDIKDYVAQINVSGIEDAVSFTDVGLASLQDGMLTFPLYSQAAPCNQVYTFFVQVKDDCGDLDSVSVSAEDQNIRVNLNCGLTQTGPGSSALLVWGLALLLAAFGMMWSSHRKTH